MRGIRRNIHGLARAQVLFVPAKREFEFSLEKAECLFEIVAVWRWSAARRHEHIDKAKTSGRIFPGDKNRVGVADNADVPAIFASTFRSVTLRIVGRNVGCALFLRTRLCGHFGLLYRK